MNTVVVVLVIFTKLLSVDKYGFRYIFLHDIVKPAIDSLRLVDG